MKKTGLFFFSFLSLCVLGGTIYHTFGKCSSKSALSNRDSCSSESNGGCTVFTIAKGDQVFFGGNDDYINPDSYYWVDPGVGENYGTIWIGKIDDVQQGVNEKGLAYDANGLPRVDTNPHPERQPVKGSYTYYPIQILHECATVEEVIEWVNSHQWHSYMHDQMQFADASGDAVIISAGADGELVFTRKPAGDGFLVSTNFNVANPSNGFDYPCERYETATRNLSELVTREVGLAAQDAADVLEAVSTASGSSWTLESLVADLPHGLVYLYYFHQFDKPVILNVKEEIALDRPSGPLSKLFPEEVRQEAARRYQRALSSQGLCTPIGKAWVGLVLASLVSVILLMFRKPKMLLYWIPVTFILGPLALLVWLLVGRKQITPVWQTSLIEAAGSILPVAITIMALSIVISLVPGAQSDQLLQLLFIFIFPLMFGWLFYQGPLLALAARHNYLRMLGQRLPAAWVVSNLGVAGTILLASPLLGWVTSTCSMMELTPWTLVSVWVAVMLGACLGLLLIMLYELWAVHHGYRAWSVLALGEGEVTTPGGGKLWWWIVLSYVILFGGILLNR